ncbi:MAG: hypothetical protein GY851_26565 [bacterium]|nr:hypothetical protein [bacterium]
MLILKQESWPDKVNFVDMNNVVLGFDMSQDCCENADWFIAREVTPRIVERAKDDPMLEVGGYVFDTDFFREIKSATDDEGGDYNALDSGGMVVFRIVSGEHERYIHLYNCHNGYYAHGFTVEVGGVKLREGDI